MLIDYLLLDVGGGSNVGVGKDNGVNQGTDKSISSSSSPTTHDTENKSATTISRYMSLSCSACISK